MNIRRIIKEEMDDLDWIGEVEPYNIHEGPWIILYDTDEEHIEAQKWLFTQGYLWEGNTTRIITGQNDKEHQKGFLFSGTVRYDEAHDEDYYPHSDSNFDGYGGMYGMDMFDDVVKSPSDRAVYKWSEDIKPYV